MPKDTFFNLPEQKRNDFIKESLCEFSKYNYEIASINNIIKKMRIARGSVYQYFEDKLDLWLYIKEYAEEIKIGYLKSVKREDFADFWDFYLALFERSIDFDLEQPLCSQFLFRVNFKEDGLDVRPYLDSWRQKANTAMSQWVDNEIANGNFRTDLSTNLIVYFIVSSTLNVKDLLQQIYNVDFEGNLLENKPLFGLNKKEVVSAANDLVSLFKKSLEKEN